MPKLKLSALALIAAAAMASTVQAQSFAFTTSGCFYFGSGGCSTYGNPGTFIMPGSTEGATYQMTYTGAPVSGVANSSGLFGPFTIGALTFVNTTQNAYYWENLKFNLRVNFTAPASTSPNPYTFSTQLNGFVSKDNLGNLSWMFAPDGAIFTYGTTGLFRLTVADTPPNENFVNAAQLGARVQCLTQTQNGDGVFYANAACAPTDQSPPIKISATNVVPEPSTYVLMASGLAGLMVFARRRRSNA